MTEAHQLQVMIDAINRRDTNAIEEINASGVGGTIDGQIELVDSRATDALMAVKTIARYIMEKEEK